MTTVLEIEKAIKELPRKEYTKLRDWLESYEVEQDLVSSSGSIASMLDEEDGGESQLLDQ